MRSRNCTIFEEKTKVLFSCAITAQLICAFMFCIVKNLDPVVQNIVSLTISLRHKFVKQISAKVTNTLLFFVEKM